MSAFTPYKKLENSEQKETPADLLMKKNLPTNDFLKFPFNLTSVLLNLPSYQKAMFGFGYFHTRKPENQETEKSEKFLIKNILKTDEKEEEKQREELNRLQFEERASKMETIVSNMGKSENGHKCIYCGKIYSRKYGLKIHIRTHTGYKPLKCKYCLRPFGDPSNLNKHVRLHAKMHTPYNCKFCGKVLVRRRDLERHIKSKHGEPS